MGAGSQPAQGPRVWGSGPLFWREGDSQRGGLGFKGARKERRTSWSSFGSIIDLMSESRAGTESRRLQSTDPTSSHTARPSAPLSAHRDPGAAPLPPCVCSGRTRNRTAAISTAELGCHLLGLLARRLAVAGRQAPRERVCRELPPSPGPAGVEACGSSFPTAWGRGRGAVASLWLHLPARLGEEGDGMAA